MQPRPPQVEVVFRKPPPPPPPAPPEKQPAKKGGRGVALPRAVSPEIQSDLELSLASTSDPNAEGPTGNWVGGSGPVSVGQGWAAGLESGTVIKRSLARDPMEVNSAWECDFPESVSDGRVHVRIRVHVSATGVPLRVTVIRSGPPAFNESALECAMRQMFRPALDVSGKPREGDREVGILFYKMGSGETFGATTPATTPAPPGPVPDKLDEHQAQPSTSTNPSG
jgi:hypothetical protein